MTATNETFVLREDRGAVATLTLNRPDKFNALSSAVMADLQKALDDVAADQTIRVVVLEGNGKAFCAGHDLKEMKALADQAAVRAFFDQCSQMMLTIHRLPQPVIAKVHAVAAAAGCQLVAQCDLAIAADTATFGTTGVKLGLFCSTPSVPVSRVMTRKNALELLFTGDLISAQDAARHGLINRAVHEDQLDGEVTALADKIASHSPTAVAMGKRLFHAQVEQGLEDAYDLAADVISRNFMIDDAQAGADAFLAKAPLPDWQIRNDEDIKG